MYVGGQLAMTVDHGNLHVALTDQARPATLDLRVVTKTSHHVLADRVVRVGPAQRGQAVDLPIGEPSEAAYLVVADAARPSHLLQAPIELP